MTRVKVFSNLANVALLSHTQQRQVDLHIEKCGYDSLKYGKKTNNGFEYRGKEQMIPPPLKKKTTKKLPSDISDKFINIEKS